MPNAARGTSWMANWIGLPRHFSTYQSHVGTSAALPPARRHGCDLPDNSIDYIFTDPPFGENIYYADLNFLVESWHRVITNAAPEAIVDKFKKKGLAGVPAPDAAVLSRNTTGCSSRAAG